MGVSFAVGIDGEVRIRGTSAEVGLGFDDILENLDFALMGRLELWRGAIGVYLDSSYGRLESDAEVGPANVDLETELVLADFGVLYRVLDRPSEAGRARTADLSLGGRYGYLKNEIDLALLPDRGDSEDFVDLTLGGRWGMDLTERLGLLLGGDVGGFGIGSSSELAWNAQALVSLGCGESGRLWAGYRILDLDRDDGGASGKDIRFSAPWWGSSSSSDPRRRAAPRRRSDAAGHRGPRACGSGQNEKRAFAPTWSSSSILV